MSTYSVSTFLRVMGFLYRIVGKFGRIKFGKLAKNGDDIGEI